MNELEVPYLELLKRQLEEEISFLLANDHDTRDNIVPCIFCYENKQQSFNCTRLIELRQFQSQIEVRLTQIKLQAIQLSDSDLPELS